MACELDAWFFLNAEEMKMMMMMKIRQEVNVVLLEVD